MIFIFFFYKNRLTARQWKESFGLAALLLPSGCGPILKRIGELQKPECITTVVAFLTAEFSLMLFNQNGVINMRATAFYNNNVPMNDLNIYIS